MNGLILLFGLLGQDLFLPQEQETRIYAQQAENVQTVTKAIDAVYRVTVNGRPAGSAVAIGSGHLLTANHVISDLKPEDTLAVTKGNKVIECYILKKNATKDYAILGTDSEIIGCKIAKEFNNDLNVTCAGLHPLGELIIESHHKLVGNGIISGNINFGRSGGGIFNSNGELIGILCATSSDWTLAYFCKFMDISLVITQYELDIYSGKSCTFCKQQHVITDTTNDRRIKFNWSAESIPQAIQSRLSQGYNLPVIVGTNTMGMYTWPKVSGVKTIDQLVSFCEAGVIMPYEPKAFGARSDDRACGALACRKHVDDMFAYWNRYIGEHKAEGSWSRSGKAEFRAYPNVEKFTFADLFGNVGGFTFKCDSPELPVNSVSTTYRVSGEDEITFDADPFVIKGLIRKYDEQMGNIGKAQGFIDPVSLYLICSNIWTIWQITHPVADIGMGGKLAFEGVMENDTLTIKFTDGPQIRIVLLFSFKLTVTEVRITKQHVVIFFSGSRFIKQKTFDIE